MPNGVTGIGGRKGGAFMGCSSLTSVNLANGLTEIYPYSFANCKELASVSIPDGVCLIEDGAFANCPKLNSLTIPESVKTVGAHFFGCDSGASGSASITFLGKPPAGACTINGRRDSVVGYYTWRYCDEWEKVIDSNGRWHGIKMKMK